jgi:hypothetical protein
MSATQNCLGIECPKCGNTTDLHVTLDEVDAELGSCRLTIICADDVQRLSSFAHLRRPLRG